MGFRLEKPIRDFVNQFQKDLNQLQKTVKKDADVILKRVKKQANRDNFEKRANELEKLVETQLRRFEPTINNFFKQLNSNAKKAGVDLTDLEKAVKVNLKKARTKLNKVRTKKARKKKVSSTKKKSTAKKKTTTKAKAKTTKKSTAKKKTKTTKKKSS